MALEGHSEFSSDGYVHALLAVVKMGAFFFQRPGPGPGPGPAVLFRGPGRPGRPKVGPAMAYGRYRPRPPPALFVFCKWRRQTM